MRRFVGIAVLGFVTLLSVAAQATPSVSRGEQKFSFLYQECMNRAINAFQSRGWVNIGQGGAFVVGYRGSEAAYITCNEVANITVVNVFVASDNQDTNVPGAARGQLQESMANPGVAQGPTPTTTPAPSGGASSGMWRMHCCNEAYNDVMRIDTQPRGDGTVAISGVFPNGYNGGRFDGFWNNNTGAVQFTRHTESGGTQYFVGTISNQGGRISMRGTWSGQYEGSYPNDWHADLEGN